MNLLPSKQPTIELFTTECYGGPKQYTDVPSNPDKHVFSIIAELFAPKSRGSVMLSARDAFANPDVDCNYLDHPLDKLVLSEGCRFANEVVMRGVETRGVVRGSWPGELGYGSPSDGDGDGKTFTTREEWVPYVKEHATACEFLLYAYRDVPLEKEANYKGYHAAGTCAMGKDDNPLAVLYNKLRVRGIANLRVAVVVSCRDCMAGIRRCLRMALGRSVRI